MENIARTIEIIVSTTVVYVVTLVNNYVLKVLERRYGDYVVDRTRLDKIKDFFKRICDALLKE